MGQGDGIKRVGNLCLQSGLLGKVKMRIFSQMGLFIFVM
jgi:hypothetical protein